MSDSRGLVAQALAAIAVQSMTSYTWLGERFEIPKQDDSAGRSTLARGLEARLYADFYCTGGLAPASDPPDWLMGPWPSAEAEALSSSNRGTGCDEPGWVVKAVDGAAIVAERDGLLLRAATDEIVSSETEIVPGASVSLRLPKERLGLPNGFYTAYGDAGADRDSGGTISDRFYWNVRPEGRPALVRAVTSSLNGAGLPFRLKVLNDQRQVRCDAAVLYTPRDDRAVVVAELVAVHSEVARELRPATPVFTKAIAQGVGFAEDPSGDESFGTVRCRLLAEALIGAFERQEHDTDSRVATVARRFHDAGLSLERPHVNPGCDRDDPPALHA